MPAPDSRIRRTGRHPEITLSRVDARVVHDRTREMQDLAALMNTGPPENGVARHNFATIDDAVNTLGLTAEKGRIASKLIRQVALDARDLLSVAKAAREGGIPSHATAELIRRGIDLRYRDDIAKAKADPVGTVKKRADGRKYRKVAAGRWVPAGEQKGGAQGAAGAAGGSPPASGAGEAPKRARKAPPPKSSHDPKELREGKTAADRFSHIQRQAGAAGKRVHGDFDASKHSHDHMDALERQLKQHIAEGLKGPEVVEDETTTGSVPGGEPTTGAQPPQEPEDPEAKASEEQHSAKLSAMHQLATKLRGKAVIDRVWHGLKHTAAEFPIAAKALGKLADGRPLDKHDMESLVSVGAMIGTTAIVASGYGAMAGGAVLSQKFLTHVAMAALHSTLNSGYTAYASIGFVKKLAHVAEGYVHGGVPGAAYHAGEAAADSLSKAGVNRFTPKDGDDKDAKPDAGDKPPIGNDGGGDGGDARMQALVKGMVAEMQKILGHDWTPEEIAAAEAGAEGASLGNGEEGDDGEGNAPAAEPSEDGAQEGEAPSVGGDGDDGAEPRPSGHDAPEQPHEQHRQSQEAQDAVDKLKAIKPRLDSNHQKGMFKELESQAAEVVKDPSPQAVEWINKRIDSFVHLVSGMSPDAEPDKQEEPVKKALLLDPRTGRLMMKAKYKRRWRGSDGKWHYDYGSSSGQGTATGLGLHEDTIANMSPHELKQYHESELRSSLAGMQARMQYRDGWTMAPTKRRNTIQAIANLQEVLNKAEGSRGGHVIGHTASGKPIYGKPHATGEKWEHAHKDYDSDDHRDAANHHWHQARRAKDLGLHDRAGGHEKLADAHTVAARGKRKGDLSHIDQSLVDRRINHARRGWAKAEGSRGGHVIGHTASGRPIYAATHPRYKDKNAAFHAQMQATHKQAAAEARGRVRRAKGDDRNHEMQAAAHHAAAAGSHGRAAYEKEKAGHGRAQVSAEFDALTRKSGDATDARGSQTTTPADDPEEDLEVRAVGFRPGLPSMTKAGKTMKVPPPPPPPRSRPALTKAARAPHPRNKYGHRDALEPGMLLHPRDRHADQGTVEVVADGAFKLGDTIHKGGHSLLTALHGTDNHRTTIRRYFKLGGERRAIPRADILPQLRGLLKAEGVVVQRAGQGYNLTGDLRKAGVPDYMLTTGDRAAHVDREAAFDLCRHLGASDE